MKIAIMQPYFFPYIGYYNLLAQVDKFVLYDDVQFTKKGWINRNYLNSPSGPWLFSIPITNISATEMISQKRIAPEYDRAKLVSRIKQNYKKISTSEKLVQVETMINCNTDNLFEYLYSSIVEMSKEIEIDPERIILSSSIGDFTEYKGQDKVIKICNSLNAEVYINPAGGKSLYSAKKFKEHNIVLRFQEPLETVSMSNNHEIPHLSILHDYLTLSSEQLRKVISK